jgi:hypothetical protein
VIIEIFDLPIACDGDQNLGEDDGSPGYCNGESTSAIGLVSGAACFYVLRSIQTI